MCNNYSRFSFSPLHFLLLLSANKKETLVIMMRRSSAAFSNFTPLTVNFMWIKTCNMKCKFCYSTYNDPACSSLDPRGLPDADARKVVEMLSNYTVPRAVEDRDSPPTRMFNKITFAGGEPFLRTDLGPILHFSKSQGLTTSVVSNGFRFRLAAGGVPDRRVQSILENIDQLAISCDSGVAETRRRIGRHLRNGDALQNEHYFKFASYIRHRTNISLKLNSVVCAYNHAEDMHDFVKQFGPKRWKVFQALRVEGQNDTQFEEIRTSSEEFDAFAERHRELNPVVESNDTMTGSYLMVDPWGRFFDNSKGQHTYSEPILQVGVEEALKQVSFCMAKYVRRDGIYDISQDRLKVAGSSA